ncbi:hypothetical protein U9M48_037680 [Paspalum notatum var. saurae]|uniref:Protein yippee-like n=1 Tax=Paspalum notatum var. saurae TaxID=547442 RepID=A0AAQ3X9K4_PASNO
MGRLLLVSLPATGAIIYRCKHCDTHLAYEKDIISESFRCKHGKAYLVEKIVNVNVGEKDERMMTTGVHTVCDIFCVACGSILGWKYLAAADKTQRYKEGKFILDKCKLLGPPDIAPLQLWPTAAASDHHNTSSSDEDDQRF